MIQLVFRDFKFYGKDIKECKDYEKLGLYVDGYKIVFKKSKPKVYKKPKVESKKAESKKVENKKVETYTDTRGITYKVTSMYVYTDRNGNYRSFGDDVKRDLEREQKDLVSYKERLEREINSKNQNYKDIELYKSWIKMSEKRIEKLKKELMKV